MKTLKQITVTVALILAGILVLFIYYAFGPGGHQLRLYDWLHDLFN